MLRLYNYTVRNQMTTEEITAQKKVEYYASMVDAWFNTSLEFDKSILTLSAGGLGLLVTLLTTIGLSSASVLALYISAILSFLVALASVLFIFQRNRLHLEQIIAGQPNECDFYLTVADQVARWAFGLAALLTALIGITTAITTYTSKEQSMTKDQKITIGNVTIDTANIRESFNGAAKLQPISDLTKSFNGAANLKPSLPTASTTTTPAAATPAPAPTNNSENGSGKK